MTRKLLCATCKMLIAFGALAATPVVAQVKESGDEEPEISVEASLELVSDYRFRGISLSDRDAAVQPSLTVTHNSGLYINAWGSNIADYGGADIEADLTVGWSGEIASQTSIDVYAMYYFYPGATGLNYGEIGVSLSQAVGEGSIAAELSYAPAQEGTGRLDNVYLGVSGEMPLKDTPLLLRGSFGYEDGAFGDNKLDWLVGAEYDLGQGFAVGISYVDSYRSATRAGRAGAIANLRFDF